MAATLVLLTWNEIEGLRHLLGLLPMSAFDEVFAVDGGSTDGTVEYLQGRGIRVVPQDRRGRGEAFRIAARTARGEQMVFFSPDGNEDPNLILPLLQKLREGYDMTAASRFMPGAEDEDSHKIFPVRRWGNLLFTWMANRRFNRGPFLTDTINGFRAVTKSAFFGMQTTEPHFPIEYQMSIRAMKMGLKVSELPTKEGPRLGGRSSAGTLSTGWALLRTLLAEFL
jgi:glycosyltransferase involved in cell wall biosynthesis